MHQGSFPDPRSKAEGFTPSDRDARFTEGRSATRRQWLLAAGGTVLGSALGFAGSAALGDGPRPALGASSPEPMLPEWARDLHDAPPEELIRWSGDLDRLAARHRDDPRLALSLERLLDLVLERSGEVVDMAGACAIRGLERLGRHELVVARRRRILARTDLIETLERARPLLGDAAPAARSKR